MIRKNKTDSSELESYISRPVRKGEVLLILYFDCGSYYTRDDEEKGKLKLCLYSCASLSFQ